MGGRANRPVGDPNEVGHICDHFAIDYEYPNGVDVRATAARSTGCDNNVSETVVGTKGTRPHATGQLPGQRQGDRPGRRDQPVRPGAHRPAEGIRDTSRSTS